MNKRTHKQPAKSREGAAMLIVLMVLIGTTATATFAIHSTTVEMRSAGYSRVAMQTGYLAEAGAYATVAKIDQSPRAAQVEAQRTRVAAGMAIGPHSVAMGRDVDVLRTEMDDFASAAGVTAPPVETDPARVPSLGPHSALVPNFRTTGSDMHAVTPPRAGAELSGNSNLTYYYLNITSRASLAPGSDFTRVGDPRSYHESSVSARALSVAGPVPRD